MLFDLISNINFSNPLSQNFATLTPTNFSQDNYEYLHHFQLSLLP